MPLVVVLRQCGHRIFSASDFGRLSPSFVCNIPGSTWGELENDRQRIRGRCAKCARDSDTEIVNSLCPVVLVVHLQNAKIRRHVQVNPSRGLAMLTRSPPAVEYRPAIQSWITRYASLPPPLKVHGVRHVLALPGLWILSMGWQSAAGTIPRRSRCPEDAIGRSDRRDCIQRASGNRYDLAVAR